MTMSGLEVFDTTLHKTHSWPSNTDAAMRRHLSFPGRIPFLLLALVLLR
jgi:hypothetical protein